jgi:hypothetical protein
MPRWELTVEQSWLTKNKGTETLKKVPSRIFDLIDLALAIVVEFGEMRWVQCFIKQ